MGLFCYKPPHISDCLSVEDRWQQWITQEKYRRLGWMVYVSPQPPKLLGLSSVYANRPLDS